MSTIICIKTRYSYEPNHRRLCRLETGSQLNNAETTDCPVTLREAEGMAEVLESLPSAPQGQFMDLAYGYGYVGNILGLANTASIPPQNELGGPTRQTFVYDELYRLTKADGSFSPSRSTEHQYSLDMSYDSIHNITRKDQEHISLRNGSKSRTQRDTTYDWSYSYNKSGVGSIRPHAPTHIGNRTFSYDANGNQTGWDNDDNGSRRSITWDEENRIQAIGDPSNTLVFAYDDTGTRMLKRNQQGQTVYVNQFFTVRNQALSSKHIFAGTTRIATKMEPGQPVGTSSNTSTTTTTTTTTSTAIQSTETSLLDQVIQTATDVVDQVASLLGISEDSAHPGQGLAHRNERANDVAQNTVKNPNLNGTFPGGGDNGNNGNGNSGGNSGGNNGGGNNGGGNSGGNNGGGNTGGGSDPLLSGGDFLYYYHPDHLGSTSHVTDDKGDLYEHITYFPFGETWVQESANTLQRVPYRFTSKEFDEETGLYYFGARYYDPRTSVWQSADPILGKYLPKAPKKDSDLVRLHMPESGNWSTYFTLPGVGGVFESDNLALYTYAHSNPLKYIDPDGNQSKIASLVKLTSSGMREIARLTKEQAVRARRGGDNVLADTRQKSKQIEEAAFGKGKIMKHDGHDLPDGSKGLPHHQTDGKRGHTFWGKLLAGAAAVFTGIADTLDNVAEAVEAVDPMTYISSGEQAAPPGYEKTWFGAYEKVDPGAPDFHEALRMQYESQQADQND